MEIIRNLVPQDRFHLKCPYNMEAEYFVVHNTYNDAPAENEVAYMIRNDEKVSFHYAVDDEKVVQGISEDRNAWHTGDGVNGPGNRKGIGVEICYSLSGGERFDKAERNAAKFLAERLYARGWDIDRVKKHQDFNGKYCPHRTLDRGWTRFLDMVQAELNALDTGFVDVPAGSWYHDAVQWAVENGITSGVDGLHFAPDEICTRAQAVTFLWRLYGSPEPESYQSFADVQPAAWYAKAVQWARQKGISEGIGGGKFGPEEPCTRAEIVTFLWNAKGQPEGTFLYAPFDDVDPMAWYCEAVAWAYSAGITTGVGGYRFAPDDPCTRAQIVTMLRRFDK